MDWETLAQLRFVWVERNTEDARGVLPGSSYLDAAFTREELGGALEAGYPVIHMASHFKFNVVSGLESYLLLGVGETLTLVEFRRGGYGLKDADLLTLSACETALGGDANEDGSEVEAFGALAQRRGAKSVLATLWPVADESMGLLMQEMYRLWAEEGIGKAEAVRRAQAWMIRGAHGPDGSNHTQRTTWESATPIPTTGCRSSSWATTCSDCSGEI